MEDKEIVDLYWNRIEDAIPQTDEKYGRYLGKISMNILCNNEDSEECINDTYLETWNAIPPHRPERLSTYLGKICRNIAINIYEKLNAAKRGGSETPLCLDELEDVVSGRDMLEGFEAALLTKTINKFLESVKPQDRIIFVKRYFYMCPVKEIAKECGVSESKVKMTLLRTREKLKVFLEKEGFEL